MNPEEAAVAIRLLIEHGYLEHQMCATSDECWGETQIGECLFAINRCKVPCSLDGRPTGENVPPCGARRFYYCRCVLSGDHAEHKCNCGQVWEQSDGSAS